VPKVEALDDGQAGLLHLSGLSWPYPLYALMVMLSDSVTVSPRLSVTFIVKLKVPAVVGVPVRTMLAPGCAFS